MSVTSIPEDRALEEAVSRYIALLGPSAETVDNTPRRYVAALGEMLNGYTINPAHILRKTFHEDSDEMVTLSGVEYWSLCEHHLLPFFGRATVGYIPVDGRVVGLSKLPRLVHCFSRRLQMQERMTRQIGEALERHLRPKGVGVVVTGRHLCMEIRGVRTRAETRTTYLGGAMREDDKARAEFLEAVNGG